MAADAVDVGYLAASYAVPEPALQTLLSAPTVELVHTLLAQLDAAARAHDATKAENIQLDVQLQNAVHEADARERTQKDLADAARKDAAALRQQLSDAQNARDQFEQDLQALRTSTVSSTSEVQQLESRIRTLESHNRDTVAGLEAKSAQYDQLAAELGEHHQKLKAAKQHALELEEKNSKLESAATSAKYHEHSLRQEIETLKKNNDWFEGELDTRTKDHARARKDKNAQIADLQRAQSEAAQTIENLRRTEASQRKRADDLEQKLEAALVRTQELQDELAQKEQAFQAELGTARRVAELHKESAETARAHLQELRVQLANTSDSAAQEVGQLQAEVDSERGQREDGEAKIAELESQVESLEAQVSELQTTAAQVPSTPRRSGLNARFGTPGRAGSPAFQSPGGTLRSGLSTTQLYSENIDLKKEVRTLREENEKRKTTMEEMYESLVTLQPEIEELRQENTRLTEETGSISDLLEEAVAAREAARKETRKFQGDYQGLLRESEIQRQQLRDLSAQIKLLLLQQQIQEQGLGAMSAEDQAYIGRINSGQLSEDDLNDATATDRAISQHLLLFKNIGELQKQNAEVLRQIRDFATQHEGVQAMEKAQQIEKDRQELASVRDKLAQAEEELGSTKIMTQSISKERDMYRRIATNRGHGDSVNGSAEELGVSVNGTASVSQAQVDEIANYKKLIKDLQVHLDAVRQESTSDYTTLKQQAETLAKDKNQLESDNMRLNNALQLAQDRFDLQQNKVNLLQGEINEMQKRCDSLQELSAKQNLRTQEVTESLVEAKSLADSREREIANLKALHAIAKTTETRLQEDNQSLLGDRDRLNKMVADISNLRNEQELQDAEQRRRLQNRADSLEVELQSAKRKLEDEAEDRKRATLKLERDLSQSRNKVSELSDIINGLRPEIASVTTDRNHLQARVDELKTELRLAEERSQTLQPRLTSRANGTSQENEDGLSREEELSVEISNLQQELEKAKEDVEEAKTHIENWTEIAKTAEKQLDDFNAAHEQYQQEMNQEINDKDAKIRDLEQRVDEISTELATTNSQLNELRRTHDDESTRLAQQKEQLETKVSQLEDDAERFKETAALHQQDVKAQAEIAANAQDNWTKEHQKHSEALRDLQRERAEHNELKAEVATFKSEAESARSSLAQAEDIWEQTREKYERELADGRTRYNDLNEQNRILHQRLEDVTAQISKLKDGRVSIAGQPDVMDDHDTSSNNELLRYVREQKDILEVQYELQLQENKRLTQKVASVQHQLDQAQEKLISEQQLHAQSSQNSANVTAYENVVAQLTLYTTSNTTLQNDVANLQRELNDKKKRVEELEAQLQPLQDKANEADAELAHKKGELDIAEKDRDHWQKRYQDVLHKYDRIDPEELKALQTKVETLQAERDQAQTQVGNIDERIEAEKKATREELEAGFTERRQTMINQFKERSRELSQKIKEKDNAIESFTQERDEARQQLAGVQQELENTRAALDEAIANANAKADAVMTEDGQVDESTAGLTEEERQALEERATASERKAMEESNRAVALHIEVQSLQGRIVDFENQMGELQQRIAGLNTELAQAQQGQDQNLQQRIAELQNELTMAQEQARQAEERAQGLQSEGLQSEGLQTQDSAPQQPSGDDNAEIERLKAELAAAQKAAEDLRTRVEMAETSTNHDGDGNNGADMTEQVNQQVATIKADLEAQHEERMKAAQEAQSKAEEAEKLHNTRTEKMKNTLNERLKKKTADNEEAIQSLKAEHDAEIERLNSAHQAEVQKARQQTGPTAQASQTAGDGAAEATNVKSEAASEVDLNSFTKDQMQALLQSNKDLQEIFKRNLNNKMAAEKAKLQEQLVKEAQPSTDNAPATEAGAITSEETDKKVEDAKARVKEEQTKLWQAKMRMASTKADNFKAKVDVVEKAAQETPERPVGEVWEVAKVAKATPSNLPPKPAAQPPARIQPPGQNAATGQPQAQPAQTNEPGVAAQQSQPEASVPQPLQQSPSPFQTSQNAASPFNQNPFGAPSFGQPPQGVNAGAFGRPSGMAPGQGFNPFNQGNAQNRQMPNQAGQGFGGPFSGLAQPGFIQQSQTQAQQNAGTNSRPNSPFAAQPGQQAQPNQQAGRGQNSMGTGPAALRNLANQNQPGTGIPRGGGIPRPSGRGQPPNNAAPNTQPNAPQNPGPSQIGRGGGRGGRGGARGGANINTAAAQTANAAAAAGGLGHGQAAGQSSPRGGLNPSAQGFQPGTGRGGQKRAREDEGAGVSGEGRGGKRARGGRGRGGGAGAAGTGGEE